MSHQTIARVLKLMCIIMALLGLGLYFVGIPYLASSAFVRVSSKTIYYVLNWLTGVPCYYVLVKVWTIANQFSKDEIFTRETGKLFDQIYLATISDVIFFILISIFFFVVGVGRNIIIIGLKAFIIFIGFAFGFVVKVIGELVNKSAELKEENDLTI